MMRHTHEQTDPVLALLQEIRAKQDETIDKQNRAIEQQNQMEARFNQRFEQIHRDCKRSAALTGAVSGGTVAMAVEFIRLKLGL